MTLSFFLLRTNRCILFMFRLVCNGNTDFSRCYDIHNTRILTEMHDVFELKLSNQAYLYIPGYKEKTKWLEMFSWLQTLFVRDAIPRSQSIPMASTQVFHLSRENHVPRANHVSMNGWLISSSQTYRYFIVGPSRINQAFTCLERSHCCELNKF